MSLGGDNLSPDGGDTGVTQTVIPGTVINRHPPIPPVNGTRGTAAGGRIESTETTCPSPPAPGAAANDAAAQLLAEALYRGLGTELDQLTPALRRRELAIARQLVDVGAPPTEAEAYARDARSHAGRIAAVDVRSYERERLSWSARRQTERQATVHRVDRTGEPPRGVHGRQHRSGAVRSPAMTTTTGSNGQVHLVDASEAGAPEAPPHSLQAEEAVLGAIFKQGLALADIVTYLKPEHFYSPPYRHVYAAMVALFERGAAIDYHTVADELQRQGSYEAAGGLLQLAELNVATPTAAHIAFYARIVADHALRRRYIGAAQHVAELAWDVRREVDTVRQRSEP